MIALLQRVASAHVEINGRIVGQINKGLLVFAGFEPHDDEPLVVRMLERVLGYRVFADEQDRMNLSLQDVQGGLLLVPQFTLAADTQRGRRPSFTSAAHPEMGEQLFDFLVARAEQDHQLVACGQFGADMQVVLQNDGPVTFILQQ